MENKKFFKQNSKERKNSANFFLEILLLFLIEFGFDLVLTIIDLIGNN